MPNEMFVIYPSPHSGGLHQDSTATLHTAQDARGVQLWPLRPTYLGLKTLGQLTTAPSVSSLARHRASASQCSEHLPDLHAVCRDDHSVAYTSTACSDR